MSKFENLLKKLGPHAADALQKLSEPQRRLLQGMAKMAGANPEDESSEAASQALVEQIAQKLGLPDSTVTNVAKAGGVAALETFADPLGPIGKIAKGAKVLRMGAKAAKGADIAADASKATKAVDAAAGASKAGSTLDRWKQAAKGQAEAVSERKMSGLPVADTSAVKKTLDRPIQPVVPASEAESAIPWQMKKNLIESLEQAKKKKGQ
jgi:hypothetical protein